MNAQARPRRQAFVGAGANLGDRAGTLEEAVAQLKKQRGIEAVEVSSLYETKPVGPVEQPMFLNLVIGLETTLGPEELLHTLLAIEREFGRVRVERWGPRTLDLDLLLFEDETRATRELQLPHSRMFDRAFVTVPLRELLERPRFLQPCWSELRGRLGPVKSETGVVLFSRQSGGERS